MKYILIILMIYLTSIACGSEFQKIDLPTKADINEIYFDNPAYGWAVTSDGELLSTWDGGRTWKMKKVTSRKINDIEFMGRRGYLAGDRGLIMKSTDRGATWQDISMNIKYRFTAVGIANDSSALVCGTDQNSMAKTRGVLYHSWNYGKSWKKAPRYGNGYADIAVTRPKKTYVLAIKRVSHSINAGVNYFHGKYEGNRLAFDFDFIRDWGFMVGSKGYFAKSNTHGKIWEEIELDITKDLFAVDMFDTSSGVAVGQDGVVIFFHEDGKRINAKHCGYNIDLYTVFITSKKIFIGGRDGVMLVMER